MRSFFIIIFFFLLLYTFFFFLKHTFCHISWIIKAKIAKNCVKKMRLFLFVDINQLLGSLEQYIFCNLVFLLSWTISLFAYAFFFHKRAELVSNPISPNLDSMYYHYASKALWTLNLTRKLDRGTVMQIFSQLDLNFVCNKIWLNIVYLI